MWQKQKNFNKKTLTLKSVSLFGQSAETVENVNIFPVITESTFKNAQNDSMPWYKSLVEGVLTFYLPAW